MTEESKTSSEEQTLAQEALDATAESTPASEPVREPQVGLHTVTKLRTRAQDAEVRAARAEGRADALEQSQAQAVPAVKDPLQVEIERQTAEGIAEEDMTISPVVYRKHEQHVKQVANADAKAIAEKQLRIQQSASKTKAMADHEDFNEIIMAGQNHLTQGELLDLESAGVDFGELCYTKCKTAAARVAPAKTEPKTEPTAPNEEGSESEPVTVQSQAEILKGLEDTDPIAARAAML